MVAVDSDEKQSVNTYCVLLREQIQVIELNRGQWCACFSKLRWGFVQRPTYIANDTTWVNAIVHFKPCMTDIYIQYLTQASPVILMCE